jgi:hypothetical protein
LAGKRRFTVRNAASTRSIMAVIRPKTRGPQEAANRCQCRTWISFKWWCAF